MGDAHAQLDLVFSGEGVSPANTDARQLLASVLAYLDAVAAVIGLAGDDVYDALRLTVQEIRPGSIGYACEASLPPSSPYANIVRDVPKQLDGYLRNPRTAPKAIRPRVQNVIHTARRLNPNIEFCAKTEVATYSISEVARRNPEPAVWSAETLRVRVVRVGGLDPRVQFECDSESRPFSLRASVEKIQEIKNYLYRHIDIEAEIVRANQPPYLILDGKVVGVFTFDEDSDAVDAWDSWYTAGGRPWKGVTDIEEELRGDD